MSDRIKQHAVDYARDLLRDIEPFDVTEALDIEYEEACEVADAIRENVTAVWQPGDAE